MPSAKCSPFYSGLIIIASMWPFSSSLSVVGLIRSFHKSHNAFHIYRIMQHFVTKMVHCGIWYWCIVRFVQEVYSFIGSYLPYDIYTYVMRNRCSLSNDILWRVLWLHTVFYASLLYKQWVVILNVYGFDIKKCAVLLEHKYWNKRGVPNEVMNKAKLHS